MWICNKNSFTKDKVHLKIIGSRDNILNIYFKNITADNWREAIALKISKEQERYLPHSNLISIAESKFYPEWTTLGIYKDEDIIGFSIYGPEEGNNEEIWLIRYMINSIYD